MSEGNYMLSIQWPSGKHTSNGMISDEQYGEICKILAPDWTPPSSLEGVEVVAIVTLGGLFHGGSGPEFSDIDMEPNMPALERIQCELVDSSDDEKVELMTVANHQRIDAARLAEIEALKAELAGLRGFAGEIYQVLGALGAPADVLDNASDAASGDPLRHSTLLPFVPRPAEQVPEGWKLVPLEPTPAMIKAAEEAHMPFGDMDITLRLAIHAAQPRMLT